MKHKFLALVLLATCMSTTTHSQFFIRDYSITTTSVNHQDPVDLNFNLSQNRYFSLHRADNGIMPVYEYDATSYVSLPSVYLYKSGQQYDPVAMVHSGNFTMVLFSYVSAGRVGYGICKYNHNTDVISWTKSVIHPTTTFSFSPKDLAIDNTGSTLFVLGELDDNVSGRAGIYLSSINAATGALNWHRRLTNTVFDFTPNTIHFYSNNDIYVACGAYDIGNVLFNRGAYLLRFNSSGTMLNEKLIRYNEECKFNRLTSPSMKRFGDQVYVFCPSVAGADGSGTYFWARLNSTLTTVNLFRPYIANSFYFDGHIAPEFEFVNIGGNTQIMISGIRSFLNSATPGYLHANYDLNLNWLTAKTYHHEVTNPFGSPILDAYNSNTNEVFSVAENADFMLPNQYYAFRTKYEGTIGGKCDTLYTQIKSECKYRDTNLALVMPFMHGASIPIKFFKLAKAENKFKTRCQANGIIDKDFSENLSDETEMNSLNEDQSELKLFPNPAQTTIELSGIENISEIILLSTKGEQLRKVKVVSKEEQILNVADLPPGIYFVYVMDDTDRVLMKRFVKK